MGRITPKTALPFFIRGIYHVFDKNRKIFACVRPQKKKLGETVGNGYRMSCAYIHIYIYTHSQDGLAQANSYREKQLQRRGSVSIRAPVTAKVVPSKLGTRLVPRPVRAASSALRFKHNIYIQLGCPSRRPSTTHQALPERTHPSETGASSPSQTAAGRIIVQAPVHQRVTRKNPRRCSHVVIEHHA